MNLKPDPFRTKQNLRALLENSLGVKLWRNFYYQDRDVMEGGDLSCAFFVSTLLLMLQAVPKRHGTVHHLTVLDMPEYGWREVPVDEAYEFGDVLVWDYAQQGNSTGKHQHVGFFWGEDQAISNSSSQGCPVRHHYTYEDTRPIVKVLRFGGWSE